MKPKFTLSKASNPWMPLELNLIQLDSKKYYIDLCGNGDQQPFIVFALYPRDVNESIQLDSYTNPSTILFLVTYYRIKSHYNRLIKTL
jgi:hypothetical protein